MISCAFNVPVDCLSNILISFLFDFLCQLSLLLSGAIYSCGQTSTSEIIFGNYALWAQFPVFSAFCHLLNLFSDFPEASSPLNFLCVQVRDILPGITLSHTDTVVVTFSESWVSSVLLHLCSLPHALQIPSCGLTILPTFQGLQKCWNHTNSFCSFCY